MTKIHPYYFSWKKRVFDLSLALILLIFSLPLLAVISLAIFITNGRPIFFLQKRMGQNKKIFTIIKFRTMQKNAHRLQKKYTKLNQAPSPMFKIYDDPRFVGIGKFLSSTGLDELPQLINIIKGEMSFAGPRPLPVAESKALNKNWDFRYRVKPGIFSDWAISQDRNQSLKKWMELEKESLKRGGMREDVMAMLFSIKTIINNQ